MGKERFKKDLKLIEIETFSYCNRACWFCPNSFIDRRSDNKLMEVEVYEDILNQLAEIDYRGEITFSRYNEPLSQKQTILDRISLARKLVPKSILRINTNGDYTNRGYIEELRDAGLNQLWIQQYLGNNEQYDHEKARAAMDEKVEKLELDKKILVDIEDSKIEYDLSLDNMTIHIRARNFAKDGSDRGGTVPIAEDYQRTKPCTQPSNNMYIDYNGSVMVCCAMRSDVPEHESGVMGKVTEGKLWDIFYSEAYRPWREIHSNDKPKEGLCKGCRIDVEPTYG